jgi:flavin-dependent dehydrogenase
VSFDAAIIGGGPAGSVCATRLAQRGRRVVVFEKTRHPRFHVGESLLPASMGVLEALGVLDEVRTRFMTKRGARFVDANDERRSVRYAFSEAFHAEWDYAFQVPRDEFDELLFRHAGTCGVDLREGWEATGVLFEGGRAAGVDARSPDGSRHTFAARIVVDASGRDAVIARSAGPVERIPQLDQTALFTQVRGAWRDTGEREGDVQIVVLSGEHRGWLWLIPLADGRTSTGAVMPAAWVRKHRSAGGPEALLDAVLAISPVAQKMLRTATRLFAPRATADFSFRARTLRGEGWLSIGDAGGFIDPLFSTGAHLAMYGGLRAADAIDAALEADDLSCARFEAWEQEVRSGAELCVGAVQSFYRGDLSTYLFADPQHPFLRRAITSMLAGDFFSTSTWMHDMRRRFPAV